MQQLYSTVNQSSIVVHQQLKDELLSRRPVVMVVVGDHIRLIDNVRKTQVTVQHIPDIWHQLKTIAHIGLMATYCTNPLRPGLSSSPAYSQDIEVLRATLPLFPDEMRPTQEAILDRSATILKSPHTKPDVIEVGELIETMKHNLKFAAQVQLDSLHKIVQDWKDLFTPVEWDEVAVVIAGGHQPRAGDITMQYFCRLAGKPLESFGSFAKVGYGTLWTPTPEEQSRKKKRVLVYAENITTFDAAIEVLKQNLLSMYASGPLLGQIHLDFDVLADEAFKRLHEKCTSHCNQKPTQAKVKHLENQPKELPRIKTEDQQEVEELDTDSVWDVSAAFFEGNKNRWIQENRGPWIVVRIDQMYEGNTQQDAIRNAMKEGITFEQLQDCPIKNLKAQETRLEEIARGATAKSSALTKAQERYRCLLAENKLPTGKWVVIIGDELLHTTGSQRDAIDFTIDYLKGKGQLNDLSSVLIEKVGCQQGPIYVSEMCSYK